MWRSPLNIEIFRRCHMNEFATTILNHLTESLSAISSDSRLYVMNPESDFTRNRKLKLYEMVRIILSMGGQSLKLELLDYFRFNTETATSSAFVQQRNKIKAELFESLFHHFTPKLPCTKHYSGYRLLAIDGSDFNVPNNSKDPIFLQSDQSDKNIKNVSLAHLDAIYDLSNRIYLDATIQPKTKVDERRALIDMMQRSTIKEKVILTADRGYESYNLFAHLKKKEWKYVIRLKDIHSNGISSNLFLPEEETFDIDYSLLIARSGNGTLGFRKYSKILKRIKDHQVFDFLSEEPGDLYPMDLRIVRFQISDNTYEVLVTNLDRSEFPLEKLKEIYNLRWAIESSFRELKYSIGLVNFHSKKARNIIQEVFAKLTMFNFCETIISHIVIESSSKSYAYQVNFTIAIAICLRFFKCRNDIVPPDVDALIKKNILPIKLGRNYPRKIRSSTWVSFNYRVS